MAAAISSLVRPSARAFVTTSENSECGTALRQVNCASVRPMPVLLLRRPVFIAPATTSSARISVMSCFALAVSAARPVAVISDTSTDSAILELMFHLSRLKVSRPAVARAFAVAPMQDAARDEQVCLLAAGHPQPRRQRGRGEDLALARREPLG